MLIGLAGEMPLGSGRFLQHVNLQPAKMYYHILAGSIVNGRTGFLYSLTREDGADRLSRNVDT
jgi:hypothetical protein